MEVKGHTHKWQAAGTFVIELYLYESHWVAQSCECGEARAVQVQLKDRRYLAESAGSPE